MRQDAAIKASILFARCVATSDLRDGSIECGGIMLVRTGKARCRLSRLERGHIGPRSRSECVHWSGLTGGGDRLRRSGREMTVEAGAGDPGLGDDVHEYAHIFAWCPGIPQSCW